MKHPQPLWLEGSDVVFFDIFHKNNKLYIIMPWYEHIDLEEDTMHVMYNEIPLTRIDKIEKDCYMTIKILIYDFPTTNYSNTITVIRNNVKTNYTVSHIRSSCTKKLCLTTLFKDDYKLMSIFYDYYKKQGVEHFYMYYNGHITEELENWFDKDDVTLIQWNFEYWNSKCKRSSAYAQVAQMHHAIYRFGKENTEYMLFCDLDEYMHIPNGFTISSLIAKDADTVIFLNRWAKTEDNSIPSSFPSRFYVSNELPYGMRSKCMHKMETLVTTDLHYVTKHTKDSPYLLTGYTFYHFYNWSRPDRFEETNELVVLNS